jgi:hypothetical protein
MMNEIQKQAKKFKREKNLLELKLAALKQEELSALSKAAQSLVGRRLVIQENVSARTKGNFTYLVTKVSGVRREFNGWSDVYVIEYTAELVQKPKKFRPDWNKELGRVYRKRISLNRLNTLKVK